MTMRTLRHLLAVLIGTLLALTSLTACQDKPDYLEDTGENPALDLPPIEINIRPDPPKVLREELSGHWKINSLDEWGEGDYVIFAGEAASFRFQCNIMNLRGEPSGEFDWHSVKYRFGTTEMLCAGDKGEQDKALLSLMAGPSDIERIGIGSHKLRFFSADHEMTIERIWHEDTHVDLSQDGLVGQWDILRFDDYTPSSRLTGSGTRSAYVDFRDNQRVAGALATRLYIRCNGSGNSVRLVVNNDAARLVYIPQLHQIRDFKTIEGEWQIVMFHKSGAGVGGQFYTPEPLVISKNKLQYGKLTPYLKSPRFAAGGKIEGEIIGDFGALNCGENRLESLGKDFFSA